MKTAAKIIPYTPPKWRVSWHQRDKHLRHRTHICFRDFVEFSDAADWLRFCEDCRDFYLWPFLYNIERK